MKHSLHSIFCLLLLFAFAGQAGAQIDPTLSIQGILKKSNGVAVEDGSYNITFRLYTAAVGGTPVWTEVQPSVEVNSGIYSATLGLIQPLNISFNQLYHLGVTVGSAELTPRILLTSAPYALSLIGQTNKFPSSGLVQADSIKVNGGVLAKGGAPGANGVNRQGYAFTGANSDKDGGLFSTADGSVSLYANNVEVLEVTPGEVTVNGNLDFPADNGISYNGLKDWRLVYDDNLAGGPNDWRVYNPLSGQHNGWNNTSSASIAPVAGSLGNFVGFYLFPTDNMQVLKKYYDLASAGTYTQIKVKFKYYFIDTWGFGDDDRAFAAFADGSNGSQMRVGWDYIGSTFNNSSEVTNEFSTANNFAGNGNANDTDFMRDGEMTAFKSGNGFWLFFGALLDQDTNDERFGVGSIEIWVK